MRVVNLIESEHFFPRPTTSIAFNSLHRVPKGSSEIHTGGSEEDEGEGRVFDLTLVVTSPLCHIAARFLNAKDGALCGSCSAFFNYVTVFFLTSRHRRVQRQQPPCPAPTSLLAPSLFSHKH